jgi:hypothetical protein
MRKWTVLTAFVCVLQFASTTALKAGITEEQRAEYVSIDVARTVKLLRSIKTDSGETTVPPAARPLLTTLKHQLRDLISRTLDSDGAQSEDLGNVRASLWRELEKQDIAFGTPKVYVVDKNYIDNGYTYGEISDVTVENVPHHRGLVAATTTIGVCCGEDTSFYLFRKIGKHYQLTVAQEADNYEEVSGAQSHFQYAVSEPSDTDRFFVVTSNVNPWCSSNFQGIRWKVFREGEGPYEPTVLLENKEPIYIGNGHYGAITIVPDGLRIEFDVPQMLDIINVHNRKHIVAYRVQGDRVQRVPRFAPEPGGFLDEWFDLPWEEAKKWIEPLAVIDLNEWHERVRAMRSPNGGPCGTEFVYDPPACEVGKDLWEIGVDFDPYGEGRPLSNGIPGKIYFTISLRDSVYFLESVSPMPTAPKCSPPETAP